MNSGKSSLFSQLLSKVDRNGLLGWCGKPASRSAVKDFQIGDLSRMEVNGSAYFSGNEEAADILVAVLEETVVGSARD